MAKKLTPAQRRAQVAKAAATKKKKTPKPRKIETSADTGNTVTEPPPTSTNMAGHHSTPVQDAMQKPPAPPANEVNTENPSTEESDITNENNNQGE